VVKQVEVVGQEQTLQVNLVTCISDVYMAVGQYRQTAVDYCNETLCHCHLLPTKFEVSISTHYKDMKGDIKCRKWDGLG